MNVRFIIVVIVIMKSFFVIIAKMENCELENPVVVGQQYQLIVACQVGVENTLQDLEKAGNKVDPNLNEFLVEFKENVGQHKNAVVDITLDVVLVNKELENEQGKTKVVYTSNAESILPMDEESRINKVTQNLNWLTPIFLVQYIQWLLASFRLKATTQIFLM